MCRLCFFFSSRRRHTILVSDWSSDVCSSDLSGCCMPEHPARSILIRVRADGERALSERVYQQCWRSEERRVGKECRFRWSPWQLTEYDTAASSEDEMQLARSV